MAEAPKRKSPARRPAPSRKTAKREPMAVGDVVEYRGMAAMVTGVARGDGSVYLDSPVCKWVPAADCAKE